MGGETYVVVGELQKRRGGFLARTVRTTCGIPNIRRAAVRRTRARPLRAARSGMCARRTSRPRRFFADCAAERTPTTISACRRRADHRHVRSDQRADWSRDVRPGAVSLLIAPSDRQRDVHQRHRAHARDRPASGRGARASTCSRSSSSSRPCCRRSAPGGVALALLLGLLITLVVSVFRHRALWHRGRTRGVGRRRRSRRLLARAAAASLDRRGPRYE